MKDRSTLYLACSALGLMALATAPSPQANADDARPPAATTQHHGGDDRRGLNELIKIVLDSTRPYKNVREAERANYHLLFGCVSDDDSGAMGLHYVNADLVFDQGQLDARMPEIVLYEPTPYGPKITGADYLVLAADWHKDDKPGEAPRSPPELYGQLFHFFDAPNRFGLPAFYTLHVWAWKPSPTGSFVNWHRDVRCDAFNGTSQ